MDESINLDKCFQGQIVEQFEMEHSIGDLPGQFVGHFRSLSVRNRSALCSYNISSSRRANEVASIGLAKYAVKPALIASSRSLDV